MIHLNIPYEAETARVSTTSGNAEAHQLSLRETCNLWIINS